VRLTSRRCLLPPVSAQPEGHPHVLHPPRATCACCKVNPSSIEPFACPCIREQNGLPTKSPLAWTCCEGREGREGQDLGQGMQGRAGGVMLPRDRGSERTKTGRQREGRKATTKIQEKQTAQNRVELGPEYLRSSSQACEHLRAFQRITRGVRAGQICGRAPARV